MRVSWVATRFVTFALSFYLLWIPRNFIRAAGQDDIASVILNHIEDISKKLKVYTSRRAVDMSQIIDHQSFVDSGVGTLR